MAIFFMADERPWRRKRSGAEISSVDSLTGLRRSRKKILLHCKKIKEVR
jgi:hypothetical protein